MTKFSNKLKKPCFWPAFPILEQKNFFHKIQLLHTSSCKFLALRQISEKN